MAWPTPKRRFFRASTLSWLIWLATVGAVIYLWNDVGQRTPILAFAERIEHKLAPTTPGRVEAILVQTGQRVTAGQVLAKLDVQAIEAEMAIERAELERIKAAAASQQIRTLAAVRQFAQASEGAKVDLAQAEAARRVKADQLQVLAAQRKELQELLAKRLIVKQDLVDLELRYTALESEVKAASAPIGELRAQVSSAQLRRGAIPAGDLTASLAELRVVEQRIERLAVLRESRFLRAPTEGRISEVYLHVGEVSTPQLPVLSVVRETTDRVKACVYEYQAGKLRVGQRATLFSRGEGGGTVHGRIIALAPEIKELSQRCWPEPRQITWGRHAIIALDQPTPLLPGQAFNVRLDDAGTGSGAEALAAPVVRQETPVAAATLTKPGAASAAGPRTMDVPQALRAASRFEPSGLTWVERLGRYVVISDDTGFEKRDEHAPWLFTVDRDGRVDPSPLRVLGVGSLNDLESIAPGPNSSLYLLASQTFSKKGKRKADRQAFLRLLPAGTSYRVDRVVQLASLLDGSGAKLLSGLGLPHTHELNIEGLTASPSGGLLLGLKGPVDAEGNALIWRMSNPERLFSSGRIEEAGLSLFGRIKLRVEADGRSVPGGVAELLQLPDGSLIVAATASGLKPGLQSGSLWHVPRPAKAGGLLQARLIRTFDGLKPEGLALSPRPGYVVVAFDADQDTPRWLELPWPRS